MSKKHYKLLAQILRAHMTAERLAGSECGREEQLIRSLMYVMKKDNPRFSHSMFREAIDATTV